MSKYKVRSITKSEPPEGTTTEDWYSYVISNELSTITGIRSGSEKEVKSVIKKLVQHLNDTYLTHHKVKSYNNPVSEHCSLSYL